MISSALGNPNAAKEVWGEGVEWVELKCGLKIAKEDYWEVDADGKKKTEFTQEEAIAIEEKTDGKYRIPTMSEWAMIAEEMKDDDGCTSRDKLVKELELTEDEDGWGSYWSSTVSATNYGYTLGFTASTIRPADNYSRLGGFPVRCVVGKETKRN